MLDKTHQFVTLRGEIVGPMRLTARYVWEPYVTGKCPAHLYGARWATNGQLANSVGDATMDKIAAQMPVDPDREALIEAGRAAIKSVRNNEKITAAQIVAWAGAPKVTEFPIEKLVALPHYVKHLQRIDEMEKTGKTDNFTTGVSVPVPPRQLVVGDHGQLHIRDASNPKAADIQFVDGLYDSDALGQLITKLTEIKLVLDY